MDTWLDHEHQLRTRAEQAAALLTELWGDRPPPGTDPRLATLMDALAGDDELGHAGEVVVHGDGLTYRQLAEALLATGPRSRALAKLPPRLRQRLTEAGLVSGELTSSQTSPGLAVLPDERCGLWELDAANGVVSFDAFCARLLGIGHHSGRGVLLPQLHEQHPAPATAVTAVAAAAVSQVLHPDDRPHVEAALEESLRTGRR
ncbi:hypothetical protein [Kineococcus rubinsiae]|uniref:hypothetical protein n=1 Tax=Kineococcus rubinsiae TaxID=2609562 RepID=UPI0014306384|nr:hypothetical protein [Kineococcus rubinsiae]NIZ89655.1 hypothetical protein [Kineococcus rubinsiae]